MKRPGLVKAGFSQKLVLLGVVLTVVLGFQLDWRDVFEGAVDPDVVEPPHPAESREYEVARSAPPGGWSSEPPRSIVDNQSCPFRLNVLAFATGGVLPAAWPPCAREGC